MKYGIDIENRYLRNKIAKKLREEDHVVIIMNDIEYSGFGDMLLKKVVLANQSKVDIYLYLNLVEGDEEELRIFGDGSILSKRFYEKFTSEKEKMNFKVLDYKKDMSYYIVSNIENSVVCVEVMTKRGISLWEIEPYFSKALLDISKDWEGIMR
ncbi:hypothetical protein [Clostridium sp. YIM B02551]|uniref:hypothetical protein n=1 Tax=Clostridium sp. YIM B02551 TaxID=2910679 RepID=UPI001EEBD811|nr:hypothetical protein [Clostridium sp. YIM B02551]